MEAKFKLYCCIYMYSRKHIESKLKDLDIQYRVKEIESNNEICELYLLEDNFIEDSGKACELVNYFCNK